MKIQSRAPEIGQVFEKLPIVIINGKPPCISFNLKYIAEVARLLEGLPIIIEFGDNSLKPIKITQKDFDNFAYVVTPVRTK